MKEPVAVGATSCDDFLCTLQGYTAVNNSHLSRHIRQIPDYSAFMNEF